MVLPLHLDVVCPTDACPVGGSPRRVYLHLVALDVVQMPDLRCRRCAAQMVRKDEVVALQRCAGCTTLYAAGLTGCPHCGSTDGHEEGADMAKITVHGGPTNARAEQPSGGQAETPVGGGSDDQAPAETVQVSTAPDGGQAQTTEGGDLPSPGSSSETSSEKPATSSEPSEADPPRRARTTASRSSKGRSGSSTARSTAGSGRETPGDSG
jgi:hypothetical protein